ncbi:MAG: hypothetical protein H0U75_11360 [Legionella sp.]|nr:hypothetical protein [Legionella sp.]
MLIHEWTHGFVAWINGLKSNPFDIYYGDWTLLNVDESVDYASLIHAGKNWVVAWIAITPIIINLLLSVYCFYLLQKNTIQKKKWFYIFCFWFSAFNLQEFFSYIPIRTFTTHADVYNFNSSLHLSPWIIGTLGGIISLMLIAYFFIKILPMTYSILNLNFWTRLIYLSAILFIFFIIGGYRGASNYGFVSAMLGKISLFMIPLVFIICFPSWRWVQASSKLKD